VIDAYLVREKNIAGWLADKPAEQSESCNEFLPQYAILQIVGCFFPFFLRKGVLSFDWTSMGIKPWIVETYLYSISPNLSMFIISYYKLPD